MALVKRDKQEQQSREYANLEECFDDFENSDDAGIRHEALEAMLTFSGGADKLVKLLDDASIADMQVNAYLATLLSKLDPKQAPIEGILELLKSDEAYVRNLAISILQSYGKEIKYYIVKYLIGDDRDLRIFAINVLGDVNFPESRDMLLELLETEQDINVAMTAVDYLAEIGEPEDILQLEMIKERFKNEPYAAFAVDNTIRAIKG